MLIAVDARFGRWEKMDDGSDFIKKILHPLLENTNQFQFILFTDGEYKWLEGLPTNVRVRKIASKPITNLTFRWWFDLKLSFLLKIEKVDLFIGNIGLVSCLTNVPEILIIRNLSFFREKGVFNFKRQRYYHPLTGFCIQKAKAIVTVSEFVREEITQKTGNHGMVVRSIGQGPNDFYQPIDADSRANVQHQFSEGCEYFIFVGGLHPRANFLNALKAFSIFKKWQKSNMKLVVAGKLEADVEKSLELLKTYKYRHDVVIQNNPIGLEMSQLVGAAYALVFPSFYEGFATAVLDAMQCGLPVITSAKSSMSEIAADAALYAHPEKPEEIAEQMIRIYKDEKLRTTLVNAAKERATLYNWGKTAGLLSTVIEETISK